MNVYKEQTDGSWIPAKPCGKGVVIVQSTEKTGKIHLDCSSDFLKSGQTTIFTGKKTKKRKTVLGSEVPKSTYSYWSSSENAFKVGFIYSDSGH